MRNALYSAGIRKNLFLGFFALCSFFAFNAFGQKTKSDSSETEEYLLVDTIYGSQEEYEEIDEAGDSLQFATSEAIDSLEELGMGSYVPKVPMELLQDRLNCIKNEMPLYLNKRVASFIDYFVVRNRNYTQTMLERKAVYFPLFEKYLAQYGLPDELKYLSIVESGLHYGATSKSNAVGLWQFMTLTGKDMGLDINYYVDERLDPEKSTIAACKYLKMLYRVFGDWELVLAAYNCGLGKIQATKRRTGKEHFWDMYDALPQETRAYVPQFVALTYSTIYANEHNIYPDQDSLLIVPSADTIHTNQAISLEGLASALDVPFHDIKILNPTLRKYKTPHDQDWVVKIPAHTKQTYVSSRNVILAVIAIPEAEAILAMQQDKSGRNKGTSGNWKKHTVKRGESIFELASAYGVTAKQVRRWNNLRGNKVRAGQVVKINVSPTFVANQSKAETNKNLALKNGTEKPKTLIHEVRPGDTLWRISQQYKAKGITVDDIIRLNDLKDRKIVAGQKLILG